MRKPFLTQPHLHGALLFARLLSGSFILFGHGWGKFASFSERIQSFADPIGIGGELSFILIFFAEFVCSILLILGLFTRLAVIPLIIGMSVIAFVVHGPDLWSAKELPLLYAILFSTILIGGPGRYSLDRIFFHRRSRD